MSIYRRPDSPYFWMLVEETGKRSSTGIPIEGGSVAQNRELRRQATEHYTKAQAKAIERRDLPAARQTISFAKWAQWYEDQHIAHHRGADKERSMLKALRAHFDPFDSLEKIDDAAVKEWMTTRATQVAKSTVNRELDILKPLLRAAVPKYLAGQPLSTIRSFRIVEREPKVLTEDEEARILEHCTPHDRACVLMALDTLLRLSSCVNMKWAQVKFELRTVLPLNAKVSTDAKPMSTRLFEALKALPKDGDFIFSQFHKGPGSSPRMRAIRRFDLLCQLAKVEHGRAVDGITFHCLRHTGASRALQRGHSLRAVMKLGGWKDVRSVMRYLHVADADVVAAAESIGNHVNGASGAGS